MTTVLHIVYGLLLGQLRFEKSILASVKYGLYELLGLSTVCFFPICLVTKASKNELLRNRFSTRTSEAETCGNPG